MKMTEYMCCTCGHQFYDDNQCEDEVVCPECGENNSEKV